MGRCWSTTRRRSSPVVDELPSLAASAFAATTIGSSGIGVVPEPEERLEFLARFRRFTLRGQGARQPCV